MDFWLSDARAQAAGGAQGDPLLGFFLPLILFVAVFYFLLIRPQQKRAKAHRQMVGALAVGDEVVTSGGVLGKITGLGEQFITLEIAAGTQIKVQRHTIGAVMPKGTVKQA